MITTKGVTIPVRYKNGIEIPMGLMSEEFLYQSKDDIIKGIAICHLESVYCDCEITCHPLEETYNQTFR